jgi:hypothetical protein
LALDSSCPQDEYVIADCRAAIREVAAAARDLRFTTAKALIDWLERESEIQAREVRRG